MKRRVHIWRDCGNIEFHPAPNGQLERDLSEWMKPEDFASLPTIDDEAAVERYMRAEAEYRAACDEIHSKRTLDPEWDV